MSEPLPLDLQPLDLRAPEQTSPAAVVAATRICAHCGGLTWWEGVPPICKGCGKAKWPEQKR